MPSLEADLQAASTLLRRLSLQFLLLYTNTLSLSTCPVLLGTGTGTSGTFNEILIAANMTFFLLYIKA